MIKFNSPSPIKYQSNRRPVQVCGRDGRRKEVRCFGVKKGEETRLKGIESEWGGKLGEDGYRDKGMEKGGTCELEEAAIIHGFRRHGEYRFSLGFDRLRCFGLSKISTLKFPLTGSSQWHADL
ncbi:hypothetical protein OPV22_019457 [Ensete ventricosum]|uniref:Uncharacterized protein n=1 Tax=Ensete ventricosum TaxID=4639 RepID=A0AAV8P9C5_ENSVE|nr:hypothetical protein OPV22_019457 [Ensete ventricosum]